MNARHAGLAVLFLWPAAALAADRTFPVLNRVVVNEEGSIRVEPRTENASFRLEIIGDDEGQKYETRKNGRPFIDAKNGESYSIRLYNPLPVRVAVNLTVDGLNSITGKPSGVADGEKWLIEPYGSVLIRGWQVNGGEARRFVFTDQPKSYAQWRENITGLKLSANCGVAAAAYFWNQGELDRYHQDNPTYRIARRWPFPVVSRRHGGNQMDGPFAAAAGSAARAQAADAMTPSETREKAGTGMGSREWNPTERVDFTFDTGMYAASQALIVYYDFPAPNPIPNPFPGLAYAPEMPYAR